MERPKHIVGVFLLLFILAPSFIVWTSYYYDVVAVGWSFSYHSLAGRFNLGLLYPYACLALIMGSARFLFLLQLARYYDGRTSADRTLVTGVLAEIPLFAFVLMSPIWPVSPAPLSVPVPFVLLFCIIVMVLRPYSGTPHSDSAD